MYNQVLFAILALGVSALPVLDAKNILAFFPLPIYSHFSGFNPLFLELAKRGNNVTVVSPFGPKGKVPTAYNHVLVPNVKIIRRANLLEYHKSYRLMNLYNVKMAMMSMVERTLKLKEIHEFLNDTSNDFDLVLSECWYSEVFLALGHRYSVPVACMSPMMPSATLSSALGTPNNPSFVPSFWLRYSDVMSFAERLLNAAITEAEIFLTEVLFRHADQRMLDDMYDYPGHRKCPPLDALRDAVPLTLVNSHLSVSYPRPYPPNVVSVAGMHLRPPSSADVDPQFKKLLDDATEGVIYFSFGSNIQMSTLPEREMRIFVESFKNIRQIVLWKWENGTFDDLPNNVYIDKWFPQQYILSHQNCKLFITHGGYHSLVEALHFGLPVIGFPFFTDQYYNMRFVVENRFGIEISFADLQKSILDDAIRKVIYDSSYKNNAQKASKIFLDLPISALDTAVYWVEYIGRHGLYNKLSKTHFLNWYQYFLIDVICFIVIGLILSALFLYKSIKLLKLLLRSLMFRKLD